MVKARYSGDRVLVAGVPVGKVLYFVSNENATVGIRPEAQFDALSIWSLLLPISEASARKIGIYAETKSARVKDHDYEVIETSNQITHGPDSFLVFLKGKSLFYSLRGQDAVWESESEALEAVFHFGRNSLWAMNASERAFTAFDVATGGPGKSLRYPGKHPAFSRIGDGFLAEDGQSMRYVGKGEDWEMLAIPQGVQVLSWMCPKRSSQIPPSTRLCTPLRIAAPPPPPYSWHARGPLHRPVA